MVTLSQVLFLTPHVDHLSFDAFFTVRVPRVAAERLAVERGRIARTVAAASDIVPSGSVAATSEDAALSAYRMPGHPVRNAYDIW